MNSGGCSQIGRGPVASTGTVAEQEYTVRWLRLCSMRRMIVEPDEAAVSKKGKV